MASFFIDANVIANWLLVNLDIRNHKNRVEYFEKIKKSYSKAYYSYLLLKSIYENKDKPHNLSFFTSSLAISEVAAVIHEKYLLDVMYSEGISFKYFFKYKDDIELNEDDLKLISVNLENFYKTFIPGSITLSDTPILQHTIDLITNKKCETYDAFLVSQCVCNKSEYFVTEDKPLRDKLKNHKNLKGINSQTAIEVLKTHSSFTICDIDEAHPYKSPIIH